MGIAPVLIWNPVIMFTQWPARLDWIPALLPGTLLSLGGMLLWAARDKVTFVLGLCVAVPSALLVFSHIAISIVR